MISEVKNRIRILKKSQLAGTFLCLLIFIGCGNGDSEEQPVGGYIDISGTAQGTTYSIKYEDDLGRELNRAVDSLLVDFDWHLSTYVDSSLISDFNNADVQYYCQIVSDMMAECVNLSRTVYMRTDKAFNPAVFPLVELWGFHDMKNGTSTPTEQEIDSVLEFVSFDPTSIQLIQPGADMEDGRGKRYIEMCKTDHRAKLGFNAIAQGYAVDVIAEYLMSLDIQNYMIELGGEVRCKGVNAKGNTWTIGIDRPVEGSTTEDRELTASIKLNNGSLATSGNYRKFYVKDGVKYSHTMDPRTGRPVTHSLLSVTVVSHEAAVADAYATAFMVMGVEKTQEFLERNKDMHLEVYLIFANEEGSYGSWISDGMKENLTEF